MDYRSDKVGDTGVAWIKSMAELGVHSFIWTSTLRTGIVASKSDT